jgi:NTE family protein
MKRGIVLSGGAAWGIANIGVLQVLEREGFSFDCIAGSSMGAIVAAVYALGLPLDECVRIVTKISLLDVARISKDPLKNGLHGGLLTQKLDAILRPLIGDAVIADCKIPFVCMAGKVRHPIQWEHIIRPGFTDAFFAAVEPYVFPSDTPIIEALLASSAIPVVFSPVTIGTETFVDLVHFGTIPARQLKKLYAPDIIIGTDTNPRYGILQKFLPSPWREFIERGHTEILADREACDLVIQPTMPAPVFRFDKAQSFITAGQNETEKALPRIRELFLSSTGNNQAE